MQTYEILVKNRAVRGNSPDMSMVRTSVGIDQVHVLFDDAEWLGFPVTITFAQGDTVVTQSLPVIETGAYDWVAEATVTVPYEVIRMVGPVRITIQGTDHNGRHIITARGAPLAVEEAGDVIIGEAPEDAPTVDQWNQAYANAVTATSEANSVIARFNNDVETILSTAEGRIREIVDSLMAPATRDSLGLVRVGANLSVDESGLLSAVDQSGQGDGSSSLTDEQLLVLMNLQRLATYAFDTEFSDDGLLTDTVKVKSSALPAATGDELGGIKIDDATIVIGDDGRAYVPYMSHEWDGTVLTIRSAAGASSSDLVGPPGPQGEVGPRGPGGYTLTDDDIELISEQIIERYELGDSTRY